MIRRLAFTIATAIGLTGLYALYSVVMRPVVVIPEPTEPAIDTSAFTTPERPVENVRIAQTYIPFREWAAESKYMLRAEQAWIYTDSVDRVPGNKKGIRFKPFALAWITRDKEGNEQAVSMVSDESAEVEFAGEFDEKNQEPGRVVKAFLKGKVQISGPDGLAIVGRNFIFNEADLKFITTNPVAFRFQSHHGSASRMEMNLIPAEGAPGKDRPHIYGISSLRLIASNENAVNLEMQLPADKEAKQESPARTVKIRCRGDLEYTVATNTAVFTREVVALTGPNDKLDRLLCDKLTMRFAAKASETPPNVSDIVPKAEEPKSKSGDYQKLDSNLEFRSMEAEGKLVRVISKSQGILAEMTRLTYDAASRTVWMMSDKSRPKVKVTQTTPESRSEVDVPRIEARLTERNELAGLDCTGAGEFAYADLKGDRGGFRAAWQTRLTFQPGADADADLVELEGRAIFTQPEQQTGLTAESIRIWIAGMNLQMSPTADANTSARGMQDLQPRRMLAQQNVGFLSPQMSIDKSDELEVKFDDEAKVTPTAFTAPPANSGGNFAQGSASPIDSKPKASDSKPNSSKSKKSTKKSTGEPVVVNAKKIAVRMSQMSGKNAPEWTAIHTEGSVKLVQARAPGERPLSLEGESVDVTKPEENHEIVHVVGRPALIREQRFSIEGNDIRLDRRENKAGVRGSGELRLQIESNDSLPMQKGAANRELIVKWAESMSFDGSVATFIGSIVATLGHGVMKCEQMNVKLIEPISFQQTSAVEDPKVRSIFCNENVEFKFSRYEGKKLGDLYSGKVGEFTWDYSTGDVSAEGPGTIRAWQRQKDGSQGLSDSDVVQANRPIPVEVTEWNYLRVKFEGPLRGRAEGDMSQDSTRRWVEIKDRVEVIHGPVEGPNQVINQDRLPSKAGTMRCDELRIDSFPKSKKSPNGYSQMVGRKNCEVEGQVEKRHFTASADVISYDGETGLYVLKAEGRPNARLTGIGMGNIAGQRIEFDPKRDKYRVAGAIEGQGSVPR